ncbi:MAG: cob(I)yrinic acid a,c-diamide adenosyltransferase [Oscillospiraceae bacterium]|nr:cob(I)yrinic acid a,c-diamide adenosyltransferase [Oscillospiraceae bacterium]
MLQIYCGDGKGKTTAAVGLSVRAKGAGMNVCFFQFLKNGSSSETAMLSGLGIYTECCTACSRFTFLMNDEEKKNTAEYHNKMLMKIKKYADENAPAVIVMDEFLDAYNKEMLDRKLAEEIICEISVASEVILTGRNPAGVFTGKADYISEIKAVKHPYRSGVPARKGIEF